MILLATTRYSHKTFAEGRAYSDARNTPAEYGAPDPIRAVHSRSAQFLVIEMNNESNRVEGVGLIRNQHRGRHRVHSNPMYNRYVYRASRRLSRAEIDDEPMFCFLDEVLFRGKGHLKRLTGISALSPKFLAQAPATMESVKATLMAKLIDVTSTPS
jgi:hypothetical protein